MPNPEELKVFSIDLSAIDVKTKDGRQDRNGIAELAETMKAGLINPITVRPKGKKYELAAGRRRFAAAELLGWIQIPALVRELTDDEMIVCRIVENDQRADAHPLDQAASYAQLQKLGHSLSAIGAMVGRTEKHVYDRVRLNDLIPAAQQIFRAGKIGISHAIVIARCAPKDQERIINPERPEKSGLWRDANRTLLEDAKDPLDGLAARSVAELEAWINDHVRLDRDSPHLPQLFEATAANLIAATERGEKIIPITRSFAIDPEAKADERTYGPQSWRRADGEKDYDPAYGGSRKSKTCELSGRGIIVVGDGRGDSFLVCIDKSCPIHFPEAQKKAGKATKGAAAAQTRLDRSEAKRQAEQARKEAARARWEKAYPEILEALAKNCTRQSAKPGGFLATILVQQWRGSNAAAKKLSAGKNAESLVRWLGYMALAYVLADYNASETFPPLAKKLKLDVKEILDRVAPVAPGGAPEADGGDIDSGEE